MKKAKEIISFIKSSFPHRKELIPVHEPFFGGNEKQYLIDCIDSTFVSSVGPYVNKVEAELEKICSVKKAVAVVNGSAALHTALHVLGVENGNEVITQSLTFVATANAIKYCGASPVFIDVDLDTMGMSPTALLKFLNQNAETQNNYCINKYSGNKISACVPMHTFGFPVRIDEICSICKEWKIPVIEDAAEAIGSYYKGKHLGTFGDIGVFSFNGNKIITAGGGGAAVTNDSELAESIKHLTTTAKTLHPYKYHHDQLGYNYRMPNINAALLLAQLENLNELLEKKRNLAIKYKVFFESINIDFKWENENSRANFWLNCIQFKSKEERDQFIIESNQHQIATRPAWELLHTLPMYKDCMKDSQKNALFLQERIVNIPSSAINV
ncbi:LegC family aminotransferase [Crocinitomicaceae bacterium]|nr:LegC family aminotransferase [Crocinitomicaceae bacterium]